MTRAAEPREGACGAEPRGRTRAAEPRAPAPEAPPEILHVSLEGYEGPLDLLLELARAQKVDIARLSILALVDQYLAVIEGARRVRLEIAADWLVMAAWLAWLKSRLLLPEDPQEEEDAEALAGQLAERLAELERMRAAARWMGARPQLGQEVLARGAPERLVRQDRGGLNADLPALLRGYVEALRRGHARRPYRPVPRRLWTVQEALAQLQRLVGALPDAEGSWGELRRFLPPTLRGPVGDPVERRAALAATLIAGLEMARGGGIELRQETAFGPILLRRAPGGGAGARAAAMPEEHSHDAAA
ncbi:segregation/condensation protein A [Pseudoroseomonas rhizosphaerae]|uniref:Segregation and condensation protein A n=1 Tax=Teichococcus rhizosphaerae TaxID=1335062 RepID=A0A2C7AHH8_9PROT|nr:ScpA family protein [Pseudoroseomonas rhizosphaerae]PHK96594.1 segregation/condensation protein A [Pseudoroseomonas rhizosphaerae]